MGSATATAVLATARSVNRAGESTKQLMLHNFYYGNGRACSNDKTKQFVHVLRSIFIAIGPEKYASDCLETCLIDK